MLTSMCVAFLCLFAKHGDSRTTLGLQKPDLSPWVFRQPGDVIVNAIFPLRMLEASKAELNFEGVLWMGALAEEIREVNEKNVLGGNLTLGYAVYDSANDVGTGLKQTLSLLDEVVNRRGRENRTGIVLPFVLGPAHDSLEEISQNMYNVFEVPRVTYTTTSSRFGVGKFGKVLRTVPSDILHIEALTRVLNDLHASEVCAIVSATRQWEERWRIFARTSEESRNAGTVKHVIKLSPATVESSDATFERLGDCDAVVLLSERNVSTRIIRLIVEKSKLDDNAVDGHLIEVSEFDDPLLRVHDASGKLTKIVVVQNAKRNEADNYRKSLTESLSKSDAYSTSIQWLRDVYEKQSQTSKISPRRVKSTLTRDESNGEGFVEFQRRIRSAIGRRRDESQSTLTLQGIIVAVRLFTNALRDELGKCQNPRRPRACLESSRRALYENLERSIDSKMADPAHGYVIRVLSQVRDPRGPRFEKTREWQLSAKRLDDQLKSYLRHRIGGDEVIRGVDGRSAALVNSSKHNDTSCDDCSGGASANRSGCGPDHVILSWRGHWAVALYLVEGACLACVLAIFAYFRRHRSSPIMMLCYSWPDDVLLAVLGLFCLLPTMHVGEMAPDRCKILWPILNVTFALYAGLLLTKTLFVQNLLKCEVATEKPVRRLAFAALVAGVQVALLAILLLFHFPRPTHLACTSRGIISACEVRGNMGILGSIAFNWLVTCALLVLTIAETAKQRENFCRTENLVAVATVTWLTYTCVAALAYFGEDLGHYLSVVLIQCAMYFLNVAVCLGFIYAPTLRLVSTWLRQHTRQQKNLTSIKSAQDTSPWKRKSYPPIRDSLFGGNFMTDAAAAATTPGRRHSGYYFDQRPASAVTDVSFPASLVRSVHAQTHVVFGYGRRTTAPSTNDDFTSVESVPSADWSYHPSAAHSSSSSYDNLSRATEENAAELSPQELLHEITTYWERHPSIDEIAREVSEDDMETTQWPPLEKLKTSDL